MAAPDVDRGTSSSSSSSSTESVAIYTMPMPGGRGRPHDAGIRRGQTSPNGLGYSNTNPADYNCFDRLLCRFRDFSAYASKSKRGGPCWWTRYLRTVHLFLRMVHLSSASCLFLPTPRRALVLLLLPPSLLILAAGAPLRCCNMCVSCTH